MSIFEKFLNPNASVIKSKVLSLKASFSALPLIKNMLLFFIFVY